MPGVVNTVIALAALVVAIIGLFLTWIQPTWTSRRGVRYDLLSFRRLPKFRGGLRLALDGELVSDDVWRLVVEIKHTGLAAIKTDDYHGDLQIQLNSGAQVLEANVSDATSEALQNQMRHHSWSSNSVNLGRVVLHRGDQFFVEIYARKFKGHIALPQHIAGAKIRQAISNKSVMWLSVGVGLSGLIASIVWTSHLPTDTITAASRPFFLMTMSLMYLLSASIIGAGNWVDRQQLKRRR